MQNTQLGYKNNTSLLRRITLVMYCFRISKNIKEERNIGNILQRQCKYCFIITAAEVLKVYGTIKAYFRLHRMACF